MATSVSVIIPTYNRSHLLGATLDSVIRQNWKDWECLVIDDGSTDHTSELMDFYTSRDSRIHYISRPKHLVKGANACRNFGFSRSEGNFIQWFDDDDIMLEDLLETRILNLRESCSMVISSGFYSDEKLERSGLMNITLNDSLFKSLVLWRSEIITNSVLFRKKFLMGQRLFDEKLERSQEFEFFSRLFFSLKDKDYVILSEPHFLYRQHSTSKSSIYKENRINFLRTESGIALANFRKGLQIKDYDIFFCYYSRLIEQFFFSLKKGDKETSQFILDGLFEVLKSNNLFVAIQLVLLGNCFRFLGRSSYRIERYFSQLKLNI